MVLYGTEFCSSNGYRPDREPQDSHGYGMYDLFL
jgi:hypothetical protein